MKINNTLKKIIHAIGTSSIFRNKFNEISWYPDWDDENGLHKNEYQNSPILHLLCRNNVYWLYNKNTVEDEEIDDDPAEKLWHIVKYYRNYETVEGYGLKLRKGDIIKLGRVRFRITEINRGKWQSKQQERPVLKPSEYLKLNPNLNKSSTKIGAPQMNNFVSQSNTLKKSK